MNEPTDNSKGTEDKSQAILVPTDFSDASRHALVAAMEIAQKTKATVEVLHVVEVPTAIMAGPMALSYGNIYAELVSVGRNHAAGEFEKLLNSTPEFDAVKVVARTEVGDPRTVIKDVLGEGYQLAVLSTHGRTGLSRFVMGSVAEWVVRTAPCPVLTMRQPEA